MYLCLNNKACIQKFVSSSHTVCIRKSGFIPLRKRSMYVCVNVLSAVHSKYEVRACKCEYLKCSTL